jgi:UrcA family protein
MQRSHRTLSIVIGVAAVMLGSNAIAKGAATDSSDSRRDDEVRKLEVRYTDVDLAQPAGAQKLYARISFAAREACQQPGILFRSSVFNECVDKAVEGAVQSIGNENLTAVHQKSSGNRSVAAVRR